MNLFGGWVEQSYNLAPGVPSVADLQATGTHLRVCLPVSDTHEHLIPARIVDRRERKHCSRCGRDVFYDPRSTAWAPGEDVVCTGRCLGLALMAAQARNLATTAVTRACVKTWVLSDSHVVHHPEISRHVQRLIASAAIG